MGCCNNIQLNFRHLDRIVNFIPAIEILTKAYRKYCKKVGRVSGNIPKEVEESYFAVNEYFKWINELKGIFISWKQLFESEHYNHDEIVYYDGHMTTLMQLAKFVDVEELIINPTCLQQLYLSVYKKVLSTMLICIEDTANQ